MNTTDEPVSQTCVICGQSDCPCAHCHGDPVYYYGVFVSALPGAAQSTCSQCGAVLN